MTDNLLLNGGGEDEVNDWTIETGIIESLEALECGGVNPNSGDMYLAVGGLCDGNETAYSEVFQLVDVSDYSVLIDQAEVEVVFGGYLSDFGGSDLPTMHLEYLDDTDPGARWRSAMGLSKFPDNIDTVEALKRRMKTETDAEVIKHLKKSLKKLTD